MVAAVVAAGLLLVLLLPDSDVPSFTVRLISDALDGAGAPDWLSEPTVWEKALNVVLFVPVGAVVALLRPGWPVLGVAVAGFAASLSLEGVQAFLLAGRDGSLADVATNTAGALIGAVAGRAAGSARHRAG